MPPNKLKLHKSNGKTSINPTPSTSSNSPTLDPESEQQFEIELCWCIQQLQRALKSNKLNPKQVQENTKILNSLMSNSTPFIRKRQLMRVTFGDYRAKMIAEDKKLSKAISNIKITPIPSNKKSLFLKKSIFSSSSNDFTFNFKVEENEEKTLVEDMTKVEIKTENTKSNFHFNTSDNSFRFNFDGIEAR